MKINKVCKGGVSGRCQGRKQEPTINEKISKYQLWGHELPQTKKCLIFASYSIQS